MIPKILEQVKESGHQVFLHGNYNINIVGVRSKSRECNSFDDKLYVAYKIDGVWEVKEYEITTDAGAYWLEHPSRPEGTAILCAGQYRSTYILDKHAGKYTALCQRNGKVKVYRDNNKDKVLDLDPSTIQEGYFGINIHRATAYGESGTVEKWSAGCQVFKSSDDFDEFIELCKKSASFYGNLFTYTLLEEK